MWLIKPEQKLELRAPLSHKVFTSLSGKGTLLALPLAIQNLLPSYLLVYLQQGDVAHLWQPCLYSQHSADLWIVFPTSWEGHLTQVSHLLNQAEVGHHPCSPACPQPNKWGIEVLETVLARNLSLILAQASSDMPKRQDLKSSIRLSFWLMQASFGSKLWIVLLWAELCLALFEIFDFS